MSQQQWTAVERFITERLVRPDLVLDAVLEDSAAAGLPAINVSPNQGKFLMLLAQLQGAKNILEIGTLAGYSTIWMARALPADGRLVTLEYDPKHADIARQNFERAGLSDMIELRLGRALDILPKLPAENRGPFDLVFIDADKESTPEYFEWALKLTRRGSLIIVDNVVRNGAVIDPNNHDPSVAGIRRYYEQVAGDPRVTVTALQTVSSKGYDGFSVALVVGGSG
jgi:predicted O-methyltransferase YrrM